MQQKSSLRDPVRLIIKLLRHHLIEVLEFSLFQDLRMKFRHTVHGIAADNRQMCHLDLVVVHDGHAAHLVLHRVFGKIRISMHDLLHEPAVDLFHDLINARKQPLEQILRPFLQRLCHNRMVGITAGVGRDMPGFLPPQTVLVDQNPHQFRHRYRRMRVIQLKDIFFVKFTHIIMLPQIPLNGGLYRGGDEEVLLFQSQFLACDMFVIRIQHLTKLAGQILLFDGSLVVPLVKRI